MDKIRVEDKIDEAYIPKATETIFHDNKHSPIVGEDDSASTRTHDASDKGGAKYYREG